MTLRSEDLRIDIFADGADQTVIREMAEHPRVRGFTTNPTLMHQAGVRDYESFGRTLVEAAGDRPISFEVFSDDFAEMERQALRLHSWGPSVYVKIPVSTTLGQSTAPLVRRLTQGGVKVNVTAMLTQNQVEEVCAACAPGVPVIVSVFAGRIADTGRDPVPAIAEALTTTRQFPDTRLLWASPREVLNVVQANAIGCDIITLTRELIHKLDGLGKDLEQLSLETVQMFHRDAQAARLRL